MDIPIDVLSLIYNYIEYQKDKLSYLSINKSFSSTPHLFFCNGAMEFEYRKCYPKILEDEYSESNPVFRNYKNVYDKKYNIYSQLKIHNYKKFIRQNLISSFFSVIFDNIEPINNLIRIPSEITIKTITFANCEFDEICILELRCFTKEIIFQQCKNIKIITPFTSITNLKLFSSSKLNFVDAQFGDITYEMTNSINCTFPKLLKFNKAILENNLSNVTADSYHYKKYILNNIYQRNDKVFTYDILNYTINGINLDFYNDVINLNKNDCTNIIEFPFINGTSMSTRKVNIYNLENDNLFIKNLVGTSITIKHTDKKLIIIENCTFKETKILANPATTEILNCIIDKLRICGYSTRSKIVIINSIIDNIIDTTSRKFDIDTSTKINNYSYVLSTIPRRLPICFDSVTVIIPRTEYYMTREVSAKNINILHILNDIPVILSGLPKKIITKKHKSWIITLKRDTSWFFLENNTLLPISGKYKCDMHGSSKYDIWNLVI